MHLNGKNLIKFSMFLHLLKDFFPYPLIFFLLSLCTIKQ
jgi:hypothetical protein